MASIPGMTNERNPFLEEPFVFPSYRNIGPPHIATLSLSGLTIGLPVWLFSTQVIPNVVSASVTSTSPQEHKPHVDPSPSSLVRSYSPSSLRSYSPSSLARSPSLSSSSSSESSEASNLVNKKKKKRKIKKKKNKQGSKPPTTVNMLENNQLLLIMLGVLMMSRSPKQLVSPSTLEGFVRVAIFLRISLVYPRL
jgi:hypothetical protein